MAITPPEGSIRAESPSSAITLARSVLATNPLEAYLEAKAVLPALEAACGWGFASVTREKVATRDWSGWKAALLSAGDAISEQGKAALLFGEALSIADEARKAVMAKAEAEDDANAIKRARALAPYGEAVNLAHEDLHGMAGQPARWLNLYRIELCDGGPEEGGWHYTWRDGIAALDVSRFASEEAAHAALAALAEASGLTLPAEGLRGYRSAAPEVDAEIVLEAVPFASVSTEVPRYE